MQSSSAHTGHREIDAQHEQLTMLTERLGNVCLGHRANGSPCVACPNEWRANCTNELAQLISELLGFMIEHFSYEEKLMRQLAPTAKCKNHIAAHKFAHAEISSRLSALTNNLDREDPRLLAKQLQGIIISWTGNHTVGLDSSLVSELEKAYAKEIDYDLELADLLDGKLGDE